MTGYIDNERACVCVCLYEIVCTLVGDYALVRERVYFGSWVCVGGWVYVRWCKSVCNMVVACALERTYVKVCVRVFDCVLIVR